MAKQLFSFDDLSRNDKAVQELERTFTRKGANVLDVAVPSTIKRASGISYREVHISFSDSQTVTFRVKKSGDIYEVRINGRPVPIKSQDDQEKAIEEVVDRLRKGEKAFQRALARRQTPKVPGLRTAAPKIEEQNESAIKELQEMIARLQSEETDWKAKTADVRAQIKALNEEEPDEQ